MTNDGAGVSAACSGASGASNRAVRRVTVVFIIVGVSLFRFGYLLRFSIGLVSLLLDFVVECSGPHA